jgi:DNA-binding protein YbaB
MFSKLKQFKELRDQAKTMQNILGQESVTVEKNGIIINMNGNMEVTSIVLKENISLDNINNHLKDCINEAIKKTQKLMAQKMQEMGGLPNLFNR